MPAQRREFPTTNFLSVILMYHLVQVLFCTLEVKLESSEIQLQAVGKLMVLCSNTLRFPKISSFQIFNVRESGEVFYIFSTVKKFIFGHKF